jgi:hypothetical protein
MGSTPAHVFISLSTCYNVLLLACRPSANGDVAALEDALSSVTGT